MLGLLRMAESQYMQASLLADKEGQRHSDILLRIIASC